MRASSAALAAAASCSAFDGPELVSTLFAITADGEELSATSVSVASPDVSSGFPSVAAVFDAENQRATFYARDLTHGTPLETDQVSHSFTRLNPDPNFQIGNASNFNYGHVDGLIDEVRFSKGVVPIDDLLINAGWDQ